MKKTSKDLVLVEQAPITEQQLLVMLQKTPKEHIYNRPAKGGGTWDFVTGVYVKKILNYVFGWNWDFEVKEHGQEGDSLFVLGRLTVRGGGATIFKEQFGRADLKKKKDGTGYLDFGNDLKAAATDALKKCASEFGIASDIYGKNEFKEIKVEEVREIVEDHAVDDNMPATKEQLQTIRSMGAEPGVDMTKSQVANAIKNLAQRKK